MNPSTKVSKPLRNLKPVALPLRLLSVLLAALLTGGQPVVVLRALAQQAPPTQPAAASPIPAAPAVWGDKGDYAPGTTAQISGVGFRTNEVVVLQVLHADGIPSDGEDHQPWTTAANENGAITATWHVCEDDCVGSTLLLTAIGQSSSVRASFLFTDSLEPINTISSGSLWSWGADESYQIGNGYPYYAAPSALQVLAPTAWAGKKPVSIAAGGSQYSVYAGCGNWCYDTYSGWHCCYFYYNYYYYGHSLVVLSDGSVWGWGDDRNGQIGNNNYSIVPSPQPVVAPWASSGKKAVAVTANNHHSLFLLDDGRVWSTGSGSNGELGNGAATQTASPIAVAAPTAWTGKKVVAIAAGYYHSLAALDDGTVWAWGYNGLGQLGDGTANNSRMSPVQVVAPSAWAGKKVIAVAAGYYHSLFLLDDGSVWGTGYGQDGELGTGAPMQTPVPVAVAAPTAWAGKKAVALAAGYLHSLALMDDGSLWTWGYNGYGQLGDGTTTLRLAPWPVVAPPAWAGKKVVTIAGGSYQSLAALDDGSAWGWGNNLRGDLGNGSYGNTYSTPVQVTPQPAWAGQKVVALAAGEYHTLAVVGVVNRPPVPANDSYGMPEDGVLTTTAGGGVLANDSDPDADPLIVTSATTPLHGTLVMNANGAFTYTPVANYNGPDSFTYTISDSKGGTASATVNIAVSAVNDNPVAMDDTVTVAEDTSVVLSVLNNDTAGPDVGESLSVTAVGAAGNGTTAFTTANVSYTPNANFNGTDSFTYTISDGNGGTATATVTVTVTPVNDAPADITLSSPSVTENLPVGTVVGTVSVLDPDVGDSHTLVQVPRPSETLNAANTYFVLEGSLVKTAQVFDFESASSRPIRIRATDSGGLIFEKTFNVAITDVNEAPLAVNDNYNLGEDMILSPITPAVGILANDSDPDGNILTAVLVSGPTHGTLTLNPDGRFTYTPSANFNGPDSFTYKASDGTAQSDVATVAINVIPANDAPIAANDSYNLGEDMILSLDSAANGILANDSDVDGPTLTAVLVSGPAHGTLTLNPDGRFTYTPAANFNGPDTFTYKSSDGTAQSEVATVTINVAPVNDVPVAVNDNYNLGEDMILSPITPAVGILANDTDADNDALTAVLVSGPAHGTLTLNPDGRFTYTPVANFNGPDTFTYKASDGTAESGVATVTINVIPANDAPAAVAQSVTTAEDTSLAITLVGDDVDADALNFTVVSGPAHGSLSGTPPNLTYTPAANYNGSDSFTFKANDGTGDSAAATVSITVTPVNDPPIATPQNLATPEDTALAITLSGADIEAGGYAVLQAFGGTAGAGSQPSAGLIEGSDGRLYGTTEFGGTGGNGTAFRVNHDGSGYTVLHHFAANRAEGVWPRGRLAAGPGGVLYGTTAAGGNGNGGTAWKMNADGTGFAVLQHFNFTAARIPSGLMLAGDGLLYGTTVFGGTTDAGTVFKLGTDGSGFAVLHSFSGAVNEGARPYAQLVEGPDGALYGTTEVGGANATSGGLVFKIQKNGTGFAALRGFTGSAGDGGTLRRGLLLGGDGLLYGVTVNGGANGGTVFKLQRDGNSFAILHQFAGNGSEGKGPQATLVEGYDGVLYGAAYFNGLYGGGTAFRMNRDGSGFAVLHHFKTGAADGQGPQGELVAGSDGWLYGTTVNGTSTGAGALFRVGRTESGLNYAVVAGPTHGALTGTAPDLTYTPAANYNGPDSFTFKVNDGSVDSSPATFSITVTPVNDAPVANSQSVTTVEDTAVGITLSGADVDGDTLSFSVVNAPTHGSLTGTAPNLIYTPAANYGGPDNFTFKANDGTVDSAPATVSLTVTAVNDPPVAVDDMIDTQEDTVTRVLFSTLMANDTDADGDQILWAGYGPNTLMGGHVIRAAGGSELIYTPPPNFSGEDRAYYSVWDGREWSNTGYIVFHVAPVNDPPVANGQSPVMAEDTAVSFPLTGSDVEGSALNFSVLSGPAHGVLSGIAPNLTYTPAANYNGPDSFTFKANDGTADSAPATVTIAVIPVNDAPLALAKSVATAEDTPLNLSLTGSDVDGDVLNFSVVTGPAHGSLRGTAPNLTYTPAADYYGPDSFTFVAADGQAATAVATVNITITDVIMSLSAIHPASATANGNSFTLAATGSYFEPDTVVYWNGSPRPTTYVSSTEVTAQIPASDLANEPDIRTVNVTVGEPAGPESAVAIFAIVPASVGEVQTSIVTAGDTATVSSPPTTSTEPGVTATVENNGGEAVTLVAATYDAKPTGEMVFKVDSGSFVDVQLTGADSADVATVNFYYPASITGGAENKVKLRYFDGTNWIAVLSSGRVAPAKNPTDNLDGTVSGGRFTVVFDNTSTPKITQLTGTILGMIDTTPRILSVSGPTGPLALGNSAGLSVNYATPDAAQVCQVSLAWDDGSSSTVTGNNGSATATHQFAAAGVYAVSVTVTDAEGAQVTATFEYVVVYDPNGGFVTGGGWINSPLGGYVADPSLTGKANFGFVSKYQKGRTVPTGETEFQFQVANFKFNSTVYEWLVVSGPLAQYKGSGTINGTGDYGFLLTASDGQVSGGGGADKFRIKIWNKATGAVVYDNAIGSSDDINNASPQTIAGGSIVIQKPK